MSKFHFFSLCPGFYEFQSHLWHYFMKPVPEPEIPEFLHISWFFAKILANIISLLWYLNNMNIPEYRNINNKFLILKNFAIQGHLYDYFGIFRKENLKFQWNRGKLQFRCCHFRNLRKILNKNDPFLYFYLL